MRNTAGALSHPRVSDPSVLPRIAERLKRDLDAEAVIVYGSVARGEAHADSDIDLLVIAPPDGDREPWLERVRRAIDDPVATGCSRRWCSHPTRSGGGWKLTTASSARSSSAALNLAQDRSTLTAGGGDQAVSRSEGI